MSMLYSFDNFFRASIKGLIYGGYYTALIAPLNVIFISVLLDLPFDPHLLMIAFLTPLIIYSYNYYEEVESDARSNPERSLFMKGRARSFPVILAAYFLLLTLLLACFGNMALAVFSLSLIFSGIMYTIKIKGLTRVIPFFKNIFVSIIWASWGAFFLVFYFSLSMSMPFILAFTFLWAQFFLNSIFFDLKDIESDREKRLKTMPVMFGSGRTMRFLYVANVLGFIPLVFGVYLQIFPLFALSGLTLLFYKFYYLRIAGSADGQGLRAISYIIVDAETFLLPVLLMIGKYMTSVL